MKPLNGLKILLPALFILTASAARAADEGEGEYPAADYMQEEDHPKKDEQWPDSNIPLTLGECLMIGFEENFDIRIERNRARISDNNATRAAAGYYPSVGLNAGYSGSLNNTKREGAPADNGIHNYTVNLGPEVSWTLFDGFSVRTTYERLNELRNLGELSLKLTFEEFIADFATQYYGYIRQYRRLQNLKYAVSLSLERVRIVEAHYEIGSQSRLDLQQANVDLNSDRSQLMQQFETMHQMRTLLNRMLSYPDIDRPIVPADSLIVFDQTLEPLELEGRMMATNTYLEIARKDEDISKLDLKLTRSDKYPTVRVNTGYGYTQNWYGRGGTTSYRWQRNLGLNYGLTVGFNIFDGHNQKRRERNARIELDNSRLAYQKTELSIRKDFSDSWMSYRNHLNLTRLEEANLEIARENYEIAMERYRLGQLSGIELREAQNSLLAAEERLVQAEYETKLTEIDLMYLSGGLAVYLED